MPAIAHEIERFTVGAGEAAHTVVFHYAETDFLDPRDTGLDDSWKGFRFVIGEGRSNPTFEGFGDLDDVLAYLRDNAKTVIFFPVYRYQHGSVLYRIGESGNPFTDRFDSGFAGFILVYRAWAEANLSRAEPFDVVVKRNAETYAQEVTHFENGTAYDFMILDAKGRRADEDVSNAVLGYVDEDARQNARIVAENMVASKRLQLSQEAQAARQTILDMRRATLSLLKARRSVPGAKSVLPIANAIADNVRDYLAAIRASRNRLKDLAE